MFNADAVNTAERFTADAANRVSMFNAEQTNTVGLANAEMQLKADTFNAASYNDILKANIDNAFKAELFNADTETKIFLQTLEGDIAAMLADKEAEYKNDLQASASAASLFQQTSSSIASIIQNPDLSPDAKKAAVDMQFKLLDESLEVTGAVSDLNLADLFAWEDVDTNDTLSTASGVAPTSDTAATSTAPAPVAPAPTMSYDQWLSAAGQWLPSGGSYSEYLASGVAG